MHAKKRSLLVINLIGGIAVLGSYVQGIWAHPGASDILWAGVPQGIRPFYTMGMLLAAAGYFAFTYYTLFRMDPRQTQIAGRFGFGLFNVLYAAILIPSALWMPLTFMAVEQSSMILLWLVRIVLWVVAASSVSLLLALLAVMPRQPLWTHRLAILGCLGFCLQTTILDAIVWVVFFQI